VSGVVERDIFSILPEIPLIADAQAAVIDTSPKENGKLNLFVAGLVRRLMAAGTLICSPCTGAPVNWNKQHLPAGKVRKFATKLGNSSVLAGQQSCGSGVSSWR
tara:strand:+ start:303 stop:614 length:312 start_codon:yes stop_codon:yes gene_type:complete